jgi:hypothetical protein
MSYLDPVRLHFAGAFRADVSTVNNDPIHYNNGTFDPCFHKQGPGATLGWWNPAGTGSWRLGRCIVRRVCHPDGTWSEDGGADAAVGALVLDAGDRPSAKIVDLDPQQQGVSQLWGLQIRLVHPKTGALLLKGEFKAAAFFQLWRRRIGGVGDGSLSAAYQSVLTGVEWGDLSGSPSLAALASATAAKQLSIKFNVDGYALQGQNKTYGRIVGTIGPYAAGEPEQLVLGRHLMPGDGQSSPPMHHSVCVVDAKRRKLVADFGNAMPSGKGLMAIGKSSYRDPEWYARTAGVEEFPQDAALTDDQLQALAESPIIVFSPRAGDPAVPCREAPGEWYLRADGNVHRLDAGTSTAAKIFVTHKGRPVPDAEVSCETYQDGLDGSSAPLGRPAGAVKFPATVRTDASGIATLEIAASDPGNPRRYIDGQLYGIGFELASAKAQAIPTGTALEPDNNFISLLVFNAGSSPTEVTWEDVRPILQQYANLYPRPHGPHNYVGLDSVHSILNLGSYDDVIRYRDYIVRALARPLEDPGSMPVTRDLSSWKRDMLITWLTTPGADGKPKRRALQPAPAVAEAAPVIAGDREAYIELGAKTAAALRTPAMQALGRAATNADES